MICFTLHIAREHSSLTSKSDRTFLDGLRKSLRKTRFILAFAALIVCLRTSAFAQLSMLSTSGYNIVNANGTVVPLRGVNLGGWFIMEQYMAPLDSTIPPADENALGINGQNYYLPDTYGVMAQLDSL